MEIIREKQRTIQISELCYGDWFIYNNDVYILTNEANLNDNNPHVEAISIYYSYYEEFDLITEVYEIDKNKIKIIIEA